ncbi:hypothetical protein [Christiangramia aquimixticola]|uniref:hypothetical protein n=1 Tax=Christiangramia aquimixticola TaxID=1697558 RepID=UPI003AA7F39F
MPVVSTNETKVWFSCNHGDLINFLVIKISRSKNYIENFYTGSGEISLRLGRRSLNSFGYYE